MPRFPIITLVTLCNLVVCSGNTHLAMFSLTVALVVCLVTVDSAPYITSYLKPCSKSDANLRDCFVKNGNEALPTLLKGDKHLKLPSLLPLHLQTVDVSPGPDLKLIFNTIDIFGLETAKLTDMNVDFENRKVSIQVLLGKGALIGDYIMDGKIMILPVTGNGPFNITVEKADLKYMFSYKKQTRKDKEYAIIQGDDSLSWNIENVYFKFDNLFNGNKIMGDNINNFLNENPQDVLKELGGAVTGVIKAVANKIGKAVLSNIPFDNLFLP